MKTKIVSALTFSFALGTFVFFMGNSSLTSLDQLSSNAVAVAGVDFCTPTDNLDCLSPATGNIYTGYKLVSVKTGPAEKEIAEAGGN